MIAERIISQPLETTPWPYKIIDDFFDAELFSELQIVSKKLLEKYGGGFTPYDLNIVYKDLGKELFDSLVKINHELVKNTDNIGLSFPTYRKYESYLSLPTFYFLNPNIGTFPIHDEATDKSVSIVVYIYPDESTGTNIYNNEHILNSVVEWVPNRALVFCGNTGQTWHNFGTDYRPRVTLNFFLRENDIHDITETKSEYIVNYGNKESKVYPKIQETTILKELWNSGQLSS